MTQHIVKYLLRSRSKGNPELDGKTPHWMTTYCPRDSFSITAELQKGHFSGHGLASLQKGGGTGREENGNGDQTHLNVWKWEEGEKGHTGGCGGSEGNTCSIFQREKPERYHDCGVAKVMGV